MPAPAATPTRALPRLVIALAAVALLALALPATSSAGAARFDLGFQDPLDPQFHDPDGAHAYKRASQQHVRYVRIAVAWSSIAPRKPSNASDFHDSAYIWSGLDDKIRGLRDVGLTPVLAIFATPGWAQYGNGQTPHPGTFGAFMRAITQRYDGVGRHLRVRYFQVWNEANIHVYFGKSNAPSHYRDLLNAAYGPVHSAAKGNKLIAGGLGPIGGNISMAPLKFMRGVLCVAGGSRARASCNKRASFDIWSHQPYTSGGPNHKAARGDDVEIGDLGKMRKVLSQAKKLHHIKPNRRPPFWITEFSWDTKPPDPGGVPLKTHARWVAEAFYRMWAGGIGTVVWFQLRDAPEGQGWGYTWQAGLFPRTTTLYSNEHAKPVARVIRFPFAAVLSGRKVVLWGRTPDSRRHKVTIQRKSGRKWKTVTKLRSNGAGVFSARRGGLRGKTMRAVVGGSSSLGFKAVHTKDKRVRPFGGPLSKSAPH
jgi:hypothetical protein